MELTSNLMVIKGVGRAHADKFGHLGIKTVGDLLDYLPRAYRDYSEVSSISKLKPGQVVFEAEIKQIKGRYVRRGMHITEAIASDDSGSVRLIWFNQPYRAGAIKQGVRYFVTGKLELKYQKFAVNNPSIELSSDMPVHTARIVPVYRENKHVTSQMMRRAIFQVIKMSKDLPEIVPDTLRHAYKIMSYGEAVAEMHFPTQKELFLEAKKSVGFSELFELMLGAKLNRQEIESENAPIIEFDEKIARKFVANLPFKLTDSQRQAIWEIYLDIQKSIPMNRLLEGDVGSGKTVVAGMGALMVMQQGYQVALLAPTEILARQHAETLYELFSAVGMQDQVQLLTGSVKLGLKKAIKQKIANKEVKCIIGTQALLQDDVLFGSLGLLIVDEQHRFGVEQRKKILVNNKHVPHILTMTATPIPRSLALTLYGELEISRLSTMPKGRKPIKTKIISPNSKEDMYAHAIAEIKSGRQVYIVCPSIKAEGLKKLPSAEETYEKLRKTVFKDHRCGLMHGKMKEVDKQDVMKRFSDGEIDVLVSTTVIEVGVSVPNASTMIIEGADRFGLAQMHQLRGRVGRGLDQGYCFLVPSDSKAPSARLRAIEQSTDGFKLAEMDLEIRGPGAIYGALQHGVLDLKVAKLNDAELIKLARSASDDFVKQNLRLTDWPALEQRVMRARAITTLN